MEPSDHVSEDSFYSDDDDFQPIIPKSYAQEDYFLSEEEDTDEVEEEEDQTEKKFIHLPLLPPPPTLPMFEHEMLIPTFLDYEPVESMPGYIYLGDAASAIRSLADFDRWSRGDLKESFPRKKEDVRTMMDEHDIESNTSITQLEPEEVQTVILSEPAAPVVEKTNSWSSGRIYKSLNITDPLETAAAAAEAASVKAEAASVKAEAIKAAAASAERLRSQQRPKQHRGNNGSRVSVLRPVSGTPAPVQAPRGGDDPLKPRRDLLCRFSASKHSSRDREPCTRSHSLEDWNPRTCNYSPCTRDACTFFHPSTESKKDYLLKIIQQNKTSFYATHSRDFNRLYIK